MTATAEEEAIRTVVSTDGLFIPLIDFGMFLHGDEAEKKAVVDGVIDGFKNAGFIYLKNHGIPSETVRKAFASSAEFFARPQEQKDALGWSTPESNRGYVSPGREKLSQSDDKATVDTLRNASPDMKESLEIGRDNHPTLTNNWPDRFDAAGAAFRATMNDFYNTCQALHIQVMRAIALGLGLAEGFFDAHVSAADNNLRLLHYPPISADAFARNRGLARAGKHTDYGTVTLLFQNDVSGLQVRSPNGTWVNAPPMKETICVNAGDLLARWSNKTIASTEHQVVEPDSKPLDGKHPARYSIVYFCNPDADAYIEALPGTFEGGEPHYPGIKAGDYLVQRFSKTYQY